MKMKQKLEIETVEIKKVKLDVYFTYHPDFGFEIHSIEDEIGVQDLSEILDEWVTNKIVAYLTDLYRIREWL